MLVSGYWMKQGIHLLLYPASSPDKSGQKVDWSRAAKLARHGQMILAGGLTVGNVATAIRTVQPFGVDVSSAVESAPGYKDDELIRKFIGAVRAAENN